MSNSKPVREYRVTFIGRALMKTYILATSPEEACRIAADGFSLTDPDAEFVEVICSEDFEAEAVDDDACAACIGGTVLCDTCDGCDERHCPACDPCATLAEVLGSTDRAHDVEQDQVATGPSSAQVRAREEADPESRNAGYASP